MSDGLKELRAQIEAQRRSLALLEAVKPNCQSCEQFDMGTCRLHGPIPREYQFVEGECPDWRYDEIPF